MASRQQSTAAEKVKKSYYSGEVFGENGIFRQILIIFA
jgi:hypothetical protein